MEMTEHSMDILPEERDLSASETLLDAQDADNGKFPDDTDSFCTENESVEENGEKEADKLDWQARCLAAESALADSLAFASLWAPFATDGESIEKSPVYARFLELRGKGLSVNEAFAAAGWDKKVPDKPRGASASKAHLVSGAPYATVSTHRMTGEEMAVARDLLGDGYSSDEIEKLYRRVAKGL